MDIREIRFPNGNRAQAVIAPIGTRAIDLVPALGLPQSQALILITGGASKMDEQIHANLLQQLAAGIAHFAASLHALVIDGGTQAGVMALIGEGVARQPSKPTLLGISPSGRITYPGKSKSVKEHKMRPLEPNHSHFVLVKADEWGDETATMYDLAKVLSEERPSLAVLINGGAIAKSEVLHNVRQRRPIIVIQGSGRLADEIANIRQEQPSSIADPALAEIITQGHLHFFPLTSSVLELEQLAQQILSSNKKD
jgi:hypothetical protein